MHTWCNNLRKAYTLRRIILTIPCQPKKIPFKLMVGEKQSFWIRLLIHLHKQEILLWSFSVLRQPVKHSPDKKASILISLPYYSKVLFDVFPALSFPLPDDIYRCSASSVWLYSHIKWCNKICLSDSEKTTYSVLMNWKELRLTEIWKQ